MSEQILLQGRVRGGDEFILHGAPKEAVFAGRLHWLSLLSEVLPRALIAELGLSKMLLGSSGGGQFLVVLPGETRQRAEEFLTAAREGVRRMSRQRLDLLWSMTENLGDWTAVRKRLSEEMRRKTGTPLADGALLESEAVDVPEYDGYFAEEMYHKLRSAKSIGWRPEEPAQLLTEGGTHHWALGAGPDALPLARHTAPTEDGEGAADTTLLAARSTGHPIWGVLRGDVDNLAIRLRRLPRIEEHVQLSMLYKQFFAGEVEVLSAMQDFWQKINLLETSGDGFAVCGSWDALIAFARELQRLFARFAEEQLKEYPGAEGKTITMALALAPESEASLAEVYERAGDRLRIAKSTDKDCFDLLGRTLEWKQAAEAATLRDQLTAMVEKFGIDPEYIGELCGIYRESRRGSGRKRVERPWRFTRKMNRILGTSRARDFQKARTNLVGNLVGRNQGNLKLRPAGRVALEWARLATEGAIAQEEQA